MNPFWLFLVLGVGLLAVEMLVFQFSTFWLFFIGIGALVAAAFAFIAGDASYQITTLVFFIASALVTALLYKPLRKWQKQPSGIADNNAIGQKVTVKQTITSDPGGIVFWSGSDWQAELVDGQTDSIFIGEAARIVSVEGIKLLVTKA